MILDPFRSLHSSGLLEEGWSRAVLGPVLCAGHGGPLIGALGLQCQLGGG